MTSCVLNFILSCIFTLSGIYNIYISTRNLITYFTLPIIVWAAINYFLAIIVFKYFVDSYKDLLYNIKLYKKRKAHINHIQSLIK